MASTPKSKIAIVALIIGGLAFLDGSMLLGYSPGTFVFAAVLTGLSSILGFRWVRIASICLCVISIAMGYHHFERKQHVDALMRSARQRSETNSYRK